MQNIYFQFWLTLNLEFSEEWNQFFKYDADHTGHAKYSYIELAIVTDSQEHQLYRGLVIRNDQSKVYKKNERK